MPKFTFSQGVVMVEENLYGPALNKPKRTTDSVIVVWVIPQPDKPKASTQDKEQKSGQHK